jgi:hypothetical protein
MKKNRTKLIRLYIRLLAFVLFPIITSAQTNSNGALVTSQNGDYISSEGAAMNLSSYVSKSASDEQWNANWIWQSANGAQDTWMCFRKTVYLPSAPQKAIARIAADSKYWLWINGTLAVFEGGLKKDRKTQTYYDEIDLAPYLVAGTNTIAALVWYWGKEGFSHHSSGKGGFLFDADFGGVPVLSDSSWKTIIHLGYEHSKTGGQPNFRLPEWNVRFNAVNDSIDGWQLSNYDDSKWVAATNKGVPPVLPWNAMIKRPFPQWKDSGLKDYTNAATLPGTGNGKTVQGLLPYDARVTAYLKIKAPAGKLINIQTDQYSGWLDFGNGPSVRSEYITKEGIQEFETFAWMSGNSVRYTIPTGVEILSLKYREIGYPAEFTGSFSCSDPFYDKLWTMAGRTLYINMFDNFMDCPDRERGLWWGDVVNQSGEVFYTLDTTAQALIKKSIFTLVDWQRANNTLFSPPSTVWTSELPQQMLASIGWYGFWNYFMNTNDSTTIRKVYPAVRKYLSIWKMGTNGLVQHRAGDWEWADWGSNIDMDIMDNAWYYLALKAAIPMASMSGYAQDTTDYSTRMKSISANFAKIYWKETEQHFRSSKVTIPDDRANAMAVIAGFAQPIHYAGIRKVLQQKTYASPYMEKYVLEALCKMGSDSLALVRMKNRYKKMVGSSYTTLWEVWDGLSGGTINHGWNAPNTVLSQYIAGISPTAAGWRSYSVLPQMGSLTTVSATVPSIRGTITASDSVTDNQFIMHLSSPLTTIATVGIPKYNYANILTVSVNGTIIWQNGSFIGDVTGVMAAGQDPSYLKFSADPGSWHFVATYDKPVSVNIPKEPSVNDSSLLQISLNNGRSVAHVACSRQFHLQAFDMIGRECLDYLGTGNKDVVLSEKIKMPGAYLIRLSSSNKIVVKKAILNQ